MQKLLQVGKKRNSNENINQFNDGKGNSKRNLVEIKNTFDLLYKF